MSHDIFFEIISSYSPLSEAARREWSALLQKRSYRRGSNLLAEGEVPHKAAFVLKGLFAQSYTALDGSVVIKYFFPEHRIAASVSATLLQKPSLFSLGALENSSVLEYSFADFRQLVDKHEDVAAFYIRDLEKHWIVEKEPDEISLRHDTAAVRYANFVQRDPALARRLKQHHIAAWLGITPESLSRLKKEVSAVSLAPGPRKSRTLS
jgi:CRP-like cAMP-binding protein